MAHDEELRELGAKLGELRHSKDDLLKLLKQLSTVLGDVDQSAPKATITAMDPCKKALIQAELLHFKDKDVRLLVAICASEIMRIEAPTAPYEDEVLKDLFYLIVSTFKGLDDMESPSFSKRVTILETVARVKSCLLMLDLDCDVSGLTLDMFQIFFTKAREDHPPSVLRTMHEIMTLVIFENDEDKFPRDLLKEILMTLAKKPTPAAYKLAADVLETTAETLMPHIRSLLTMVNEAGEQAPKTNDGEEQEPPPEWLVENYEELVVELCRCSSVMFVALIPDLHDQLLVKDAKNRLRAVRIVGRVLPARQKDAQKCRQLVSKLAKRFIDMDVDVRVAAIEAAKTCLLAKLPHCGQLLSPGLEERLLDPDPQPRLAAVSALCDLVISDFKSVPSEIFENIGLRLRDKKPPVRAATLQKLCHVYSTYCAKYPSTFKDHLFEWIPGKILKFYPDFRPQNIEMVFYESLFPADLSVDERAKHWVLMFSAPESRHSVLVERFLHQKYRFQREVRNYLVLHQRQKEEIGSETELKLQTCFKTIALGCVDSLKDEEILKLQKMTDDNVVKALSTLLDPKTSVSDAQATIEDLLKSVPKGSHDFYKTFAVRCSYLVFGREHVRSVFKILSDLRAASNEEMVSACLSLLVVFAGAFPDLMEGSEEDILDLLKESEDDFLREAAVHILSQAGRCLRKKITDMKSPVNLTLEKLCLEGTRRQAKYAVSAIAALSNDSGIKALSVLYKNLLSALESRSHLSTVLQSLGCIAQTAMPVYETRESEVVKFIVEDVLPREATQDSGDSTKADWSSISEECLLKISGLKTLVKSFLPNKDAQSRKRLKDVLFPILVKLLQHGSEAKSSDVDKAHLRLEAAKSVLRLSRNWDKEIPYDMFKFTVLTAQDIYLEVRQQVLAKTHKYVKNQQVPSKYAVVYALCANDTMKDVATEAKRFMAEFVERERLRRGEGRDEPHHLPEYVLTYVIHILAHHPNFPASSAEAADYEPFYRQLFFYLNALLGQEVEGKKDENSNLATIQEIFRAIKRTEDAVDASKTQNVYTLCDMGLQIAKELDPKRLSGTFSGTVPLPVAFYKPLDDKTASEADGSALPQCLTEEVLGQYLKAAVKRPGKRGKKAADDSSADDDDDPPSKKHRSDGETSDKKTAKSKVGRGRKSNKSEDEENAAPKRKRGRPSKEETAKHKKPEATEETPAPKKRGRPKGSKKVKVDESPATSAEAKGEKKSAKRDHKAMEAKRASSEDGDKEEGASKRRKVEKSTPTKNGTEEGEALVGRKVKVWWPIDKRYYKGTVASYDAESRMHKVAYVDGDVEVLKMDEEKWLFTDEHKQGATPSSPSTEKKKKAKEEEADSSQKIRKKGSAEKSKEKKERSEGQHQSENEGGKKDKYSKVNGSNRAANGDAESSQPGASNDGGESSEDETLDSYRRRRKSPSVAAAGTPAARTATA